jgi:hypothetical protein
MKILSGLWARRTITLFSATGGLDLFHDRLACSIRAETGSVASVAGTAGKKSTHLLLSVSFFRQLGKDRLTAQVWASALAARGEVAAVAAAAKARRVTNERIFANVCWSKLSWAVKL